MTCGPGEVCITCSDAADALVVRSIDAATGLALCVDAAGTETEVDVTLVDAAPGAGVLVHAGVAIGMAA
jgi:hydrogenase maturation factor